MKPNFKRLRLACYATSTSQSIVGNLSPLLFLTFRSLYGISYSLLGLLVLINFVTQLTVDILFSLFSHKINIPRAVKGTPFVFCAGLLMLALAPIIFSESVYVGLVVATVIISSAGGLIEVLTSPVLATIPSDDPDRAMSRLHSMYAWGCVGLVLFVTLFLFLFGNKFWQLIPLILMAMPLFSAFLFFGIEIPAMKTPEKTSGALKMLKKRGLVLCVLAIFLGGAVECTMAQWSSTYIEAALGISKIWGDIFGVAMFALALGIGRSLYGSRGKNIKKTLLFGAVGATVCYFTAALSQIPVISLIACAATGFFAAMLWPGSLIVASERYPDGGVFIFALMAAGGDLGASILPQLIGVITDAVIITDVGKELALTLSMSTEELGMKIGMAAGGLFALAAVLVYFIILKSFKKSE